MFLAGFLKMLNKASFSSIIYFDLKKLVDFFSFFERERVQFFVIFKGREDFFHGSLQFLITLLVKIDFNFLSSGVVSFA